MAIFPVALSLSYIRTLSRLAIASTLANVLEAAGIVLILQYLLRGLQQVDLVERAKLKSLDSIALGFGSAMFAFEGISVVLPVYSRMQNPIRMSNCAGIINVAYTLLLMLYFLVGMSGFLRYGDQAGDSITLNLPPEPLYDAVRAMFMMAVFLTYPLQFYVPNEIIWNWIKRLAFEKSNSKAAPESEDTIVTEPVAPPLAPDDMEPADPRTPGVDSTASSFWANGSGSVIIRSNASIVHDGEASSLSRSGVEDEGTSLIFYEYVCRTVLVVLTFGLAISVPKLNLLMDLIGSITGTLLSFILPALIHLATFWDEMKGSAKVMVVVIDVFIIVFGAVAGVCGATSSMSSILKSFGF